MTKLSTQQELPPNAHVEVISIPRARAYWLVVDELGSQGIRHVQLELIGQPGDSVQVDTSRNADLQNMGFMRSLGDYIPVGTPPGPNTVELEVPEGRVALAVTKIDDRPMRQFYKRTNEIYKQRRRELKGQEGVEDLVSRSRSSGKLLKGKEDT